MNFLLIFLIVFGVILLIGYIPVHIWTNQIIGHCNNIIKNCDKIKREVDKLRETTD